MGDPLSLFASTFFLLCLHFVKQGVQALEIALPKTPVPLEPDLKLLERRGPQGINAALSCHANVHQSGITEHAEMFRDLGLAETQAMDQVADRAWPVTQEFDDSKTVRLGQRFQCFHHGESEYASRRIFLSRHILYREYTKRGSRRETKCPAFRAVPSPPVSSAAAGVLWGVLNT